ncbi:MAG: hypothetical protein JEZ08_22190 [Clostridiales bacterium]|nr:hypothetical protein [Clostridiales bacterium]
MKKRKLLIIIPIAMVLIVVNLMSRFTSIEDNLRYQYGTPIAEVEIVDDAHQLVLFSMDDSIGITRYTRFINFYTVKDDYGHVKPKDDIFVAVSERAEIDNIIWGQVDSNTSKIELEFYKETLTYSVDLDTEEGYFYYLADCEHNLNDPDWKLRIKTFDILGDLLKTEEVPLYKDL